MALTLDAPEVKAPVVAIKVTRTIVDFEKDIVYLHLVKVDADGAATQPPIVLTLEGTKAQQFYGGAAGARNRSYLAVSALLNVKGAVT